MSHLRIEMLSSIVVVRPRSTYVWRCIPSPVKQKSYCPLCLFVYHVEKYSEDIEKWKWMILKCFISWPDIFIQVFFGGGGFLFTRIFSFRRYGVPDTKFGRNPPLGPLLSKSHSVLVVVPQPNLPLRML